MTTLGDDMPEFAGLTLLTDMTMRYQIIGWTNNLEIVQVVDDWYTASPELPQYGGGEMMIDIADVSHIGSEIVN
jgi:hypothetical protein